jgi:LuxR family maltose regulon positive regulatory protein
VSEQFVRVLPRLPRHMLRRPQLEKRLGEWTAVTVIQGIRGCGKTTLLADWLNRQPNSQVTVAWVTATREMAEREQLVGQLVRRLRLATGAPPGVLPMAAVTLGDLDEALLRIPARQRIALVIDDVQHLDDPTLLGDLVSLVQRHERVHLFACCLARHRLTALAGGSLDLNMIRPDELMLSIDEIAELAVGMGTPVTAEQASMIYDAIGGWISAVRVLIGATRDGGQARQAVHDYLSYAVLPRITERVALGYLMKFSLATELDSRLVHDLAGEIQPRQLLRLLEEPGLLEYQQHGDRLVLRLPSMIRDVLNEAYRSREPAAARAFDVQLAHWYAEHEGPDYEILAVEHAVAGEDFEFAHALWGEHGMTLSLLRLDRLRHALRRIPAEVIADYPGMAVSLATMDSYAAGDDVDSWTATARVYVDGSARALAQQQGALPLPDLLYAGAGRIMGLRTSGRFTAAASLSTELEARVAGLATDANTLDTRFAWFHLQTAITQTLIGDGDAAIRHYLRAWERSGKVRPDFVAANVAATLAMIHMLRGDAGAATHWLERRAGCKPGNTRADQLTRVGTRVATGLMALDRLDEPGARAAVAGLGEGIAALDFWAYLAYLYAQYSLHFGEPASALTTLDRLQSAHAPELRNQGAAAVLLLRARADLLIAGGYGQRARALLSARPASAAITGRAMLAVPRARLDLLSGDCAAVRGVTVSLTVQQHTHRRHWQELLLLEAVAALRMNDRQASARLTRCALEAYRQTRSLRTLATIPAEELRELLGLAGYQLDPRDAATLACLPPVYPNELTLVTLTKREAALLLALQANASRQVIAETLYVSPNTVKTQTTSLYRKLGTGNRSDTLARARQLGLLL